MVFRTTLTFFNVHSSSVSLFAYDDPYEAGFLWTNLLSIHNDPRSFDHRHMRKHYLRASATFFPPHPGLSNR